MEEIKPHASLWESLDKVYKNCKCPSCATSKTKLLSDEEIAEIYHSENRISPQGNFDYYGFARAIEKAHGISGS